MKISAPTSRVLDQAFEIGAFGATEANGELVVLPGADWPLKAEFVSELPDLLVSGRDVESFAICDYFHGDTATDLVTEGGSLLRLNLIERLATGGPAPGQYAQAVTMDGEGIKQVETLVGNATAQRANGTEMPLTAGAPFYAGDVLQTLAEASIGIALAKKKCRLARIAVCFSMSSFTFQAQNGGNGREYHLSLFTSVSGESRSRTGRNDSLSPPS